MSGISVIIPAYRGDLGAALAALAAQEPLPAEVVVVLADPGAPEPAGGWPFRLRVRRAARRLHYGAAVNLGFQAASGEDLLVMNDDAAPLAGALAALAAARARHGAALYQPRILLTGAARLDNVGHGLFPDGFNLARGREALDGADFSREGTVGAVSGAAFLIPRAVLAEVGPFDESLLAFGEDVDLSLRAVRRGVPLRYVPAARFEHALGASYGRFGARKVFLVERNRVRAAVRSLPASIVLTLPAWTVLRWSVLAVGWRWARPAGPAGALAAAAGTAAALAWLPDALAKRRQDAPRWRRGEAAMWRHLLAERVRLRDLR